MRLLFIIKSIDNEPHGILHIASVLERAGHEVELVVATEADPLQVAREMQPRVVGYSVYTGTQKYYLDVNKRIKAQARAAGLPEPLSIFGGPHPTFFPEIINEEGVDAVCIGEGEFATLDLLNALERGEPIKHIQNWIIKKDGQVYHNPLRPLVDDLDSLPFVNRELLYRNHAPSKNVRIRPFITARGCPYNCSFCFNHAYSELYDGKGKRVRRRSVNSVLREIKAVQREHPLEFVLFLDDTFILNRQWLREFAPRYHAEIGLPFWCQVRANLINDEIVRLLKDAGCVSVSFGLETANDQMRNEILKRDMSKEEIITAARLIKAHGIALMTNNMLGLPRGSLATDWETLELNIACRPDYANVFLYQPYPKTELGEMALREGYMDGTFDDLSGSVTEGSLIRFADPADKRQIENLQKLLAITVEFPWLKPLVRQLIKLPSNPAFWLIYKLWKGYALKFRMYPYHQSPREFAQAGLQYMRIRSQ